MVLGSIGSAIGLVWLIFLRWKASKTNNIFAIAAQKAAEAARAATDEAICANDAAAKELKLDVRPWIGIGGFPYPDSFTPMKTSFTQMTKSV